MAERTTTVESEESNDPDDELLDRFEERYQTEQVLNSSSGVEATITHAGWRDGANKRYVGAICLHLSVPGGTDYPIVVPNIAEGTPGEDFLSLLHWLEQSPQQDLSALEGESVAIDIMSTGEKEFVKIATGVGILHGQIVDDPDLVENAPSTLPSAVLDVLTRVDRYRRSGGGGNSIRIVELSATEDELVMHLPAGWGTIRVPVERAYEPTPQTPYEKLVEYVGEGSVKQIEGGSVHLVHASDLPDSLGTPFAHLTEAEREEAYDGYITTTHDFAGEWALFFDTPPTSSVSPGGDLTVAGGALLTASLLFIGFVTGNPLFLLLGLGGLILLAKYAF